MTDHLRHAPEFFEAVRARLMKGAAEYGDWSFSSDPANLIEELKQEALDLAGWGYILFSRLQAMQGAFESAKVAYRDALSRMRETADSCDCGASQNWLSAVDRAVDASEQYLGDGRPRAVPIADIDASTRATSDRGQPVRMVGAERCSP